MTGLAVLIFLLLGVSVLVPGVVEWMAFPPGAGELVLGARGTSNNELRNHPGAKNHANQNASRASDVL
jgi:hypothetical protein